MSDPLRTESSRMLDASNSDRDATIERLLLLGLDHYFSAEYDQAIHVWTRALFLDRGHARARAYIERARSALAERQRESEELLHSGLAAFERGEADEARRLLEAAIIGGAPPDEALSVLERLNRLQQREPVAPVPGGERARRVRQASHSAAPDRSRRRARSWLSLALLAGAAIAGGVGLARPARTWLGAAGRPYLGWLRSRPLPATTGPFAMPDAQLVLPPRSEILLSRARALSAGGHLREALTALDGIRASDAERPAADELRATLQRQLIELAPTGATLSVQGQKPDGGRP
jgi:hypothetical protein